MENEKSNNNEIIEANVYEQDIKNMIHTVRGKQVMLDSDVAMLYHYETRRINETVKRNVERFPEKFCFQLTESEFQTLRFQNGTLKTMYQKRTLRFFLKSQIATSKLGRIYFSNCLTKIFIQIFWYLIDKKIASLYTLTRW